jgi:hypothetical protein
LLLSLLPPKSSHRELRGAAAQQQALRMEYGIHSTQLALVLWVMDRVFMHRRVLSVDQACAYIVCNISHLFASTFFACVTLEQQVLKCMCRLHHFYVCNTGSF